MLREAPRKLLTDPQWHALLPHVLPRSPAGRRIPDLRHRMNAIFHLALTRGDPWRALPPDYGNPDTVARFFRRLTHAGLWHRLLQLLHDASPDHPLRAIEPAILRATRRAARIGGLPLLLLIRRLGLRKALPAPPWLLPDPDLSETLARLTPTTAPTTRPALRAQRTLLGSLAWLLRATAGRRRIPRTVRLAW